ncbi:EGF-like domain protein, partial [Ostertagia ostertagi]
EDLCVTLNPCPSVNGSRYKCTSGTGSYKCECAVGYTGEKCDKDAKSICKWDTCLNGGTCTTTNNIVYKCLCTPEYIGSRCQTDSPVLDGCFARDPILEDSNYYKKFTQPTPMSVTNCMNVLQSQIPTYTMF